MKWFLDPTTLGKLFAGFGLMAVFLARAIATAYTGITARQRLKTTGGAVQGMTANLDTEILKETRP